MNYGFVLSDFNELGNRAITGEKYFVRTGPELSGEFLIHNPFR